MARDWGTYSGWEVAGDDSDHSCSLGRQHEGPGSTLLGIGTNLDEKHTIVIINNENWTVKPQEVLNLAIRLDGVTAYVYTGKAVGFLGEGRNGRERQADRDFP
jgi:hypothetical protein